MTVAYVFTSVVQTLDSARRRSGSRLFEFTVMFQPPFDLPSSDGFH